MRSRSSVKFIIAFLAVVLSALLQMRFLPLGLRGDFTLAALVALSFFLTFGELAVLAAFAAGLLNWQPAVTLELLLFVAIPLGVALIRRFVPWQSSLAYLTLSVAALLLFYLLVDYSLFLGIWKILLQSWLLSLAFGLGLFYVFASRYPQVSFER